MNINFSTHEWAAFMKHLGMSERTKNISAGEVPDALNTRRNVALSLGRGDDESPSPADTALVKDAEKMSKRQDW